MSRWIVVLFFIVSAFGAYAKDKGCSISSKDANIGGIYLSAPVKDIKKRYPTMVLEPESKQEGRVAFMENGVYKEPVFPRIDVFMGIFYAFGEISSFVVRFDDKQANIDTSLTQLTKAVIDWYHLPNKGWRKLGKTRNRLVCDGVVVEVSQDHGEGRMASGPTMMMYFKN